MGEDILWEAQPHTVAKIKILHKYLTAWFQILGRSKAGKDIIYIDGFAGPGKYTNNIQGSPIEAIKAAVEAQENAGVSAWKAGKARFFFIEEVKDRFTHLLGHVQAFKKYRNIEIEVINETFEKGIDVIRNKYIDVFRDSLPVFVFIDPFGATGIPFNLVQSLLGGTTTEVLINFDADGIGRIFRAKEKANHVSHMNEIFGGNEWTKFDQISDFQILCSEALNLYKSKLKKIRGIEYVFSFQMKQSDKVSIYFLVFASRHPLGLEKMKEAMKALDQNGDYSFSNTDVGQEILFRYDDPSDFAMRMHSFFRGKKVSYRDAHHFALNETPSTNPKSMLAGS